MNCPFCLSDIQTTVFARSSRFMAIYNMAPILPGHSLIIPKKHIQSIMELKEGEVTEMILFARKVTAMLMKIFKAESFNWSVQEGEAAGQTMSHLHMHIVLRFPGDMPDPGDWYPKIQENYNTMLDSKSRTRLKNSEMERIIQKLRENSKEEGLFDA
jgi:bis(5'-adenosyl)-triphosphatase